MYCAKIHNVINGSRFWSSNSNSSMYCLAVDVYEWALCAFRPYVSHFFINAFLGQASVPVCIPLCGMASNAISTCSKQYPKNHDISQLHSGRLTMKNKYIYPAKFSNCFTIICLAIKNFLAVCVPAYRLRCIQLLATDVLI